MQKLIDVDTTKAPVHCSMESVGAHVVFTVGNLKITLGYKDALTLSDYMRVRAKESKAFARDTSRDFHIVANLTDAEIYLNDHANIREV